MDITTRDVKADNGRYIALYKRSKESGELTRLRNSRHGREVSLLSTTRTCSPGTLDLMRDRLGSIDTSAFKSTIRRDFYNPNVMVAAMCTAESVIYTESNNGLVTPEQRIRHYIRKLRRIGEESVDGYAMVGDLEHEDAAFVLKAPRGNGDDLVHEYFIGLMGTNKLRFYVPNFAYMYGAFKCSPPIIGEDSQVESWCSTSPHKVNYILYENISPSVSLNRYIRNGCTARQWLEIYMQVLYALNVANEKIGFTHYDLHSDNVLVRDIGEGMFQIPYNTENGRTEYMEVGKVATIIDFGISRIRSGQESYGIYNMFPWGVFPTKVYPMHDAYKLLMMSARTMVSSGNDDCLRVAKVIFRFFNKQEDILEAVRDQSKYYYYLPYIKGVSDVGIFNLTRYIRSKINVNFITPVTKGNDKLLSCNSINGCMLYNTTLRKFGFSNSITATSVFEFYDIVSRLKLQGRLDDVLSVRESFDVDKGVEDAFKLIDSIMERNGFKLTNIYTIRKQSLNILQDKGLLMRYRSFAEGVVSLYDSILEIKTIIESIEFVSREYNTGKYQNRTSEIRYKIDSHLTYLNKAVDSMRQDSMYIESKRKILTRRLKGHYRWWLTDLRTILSVIRV